MVYELTEGVSLIMRMYPRTSGIVIIGEFNKRQVYWDGVTFNKFDDETRTEDPQTFRTIRNASKRLEKILQDSYLIKDIKLAFWIHPDFYVSSIEKYELMSGSCLPGCVRR